MRRLLVVLLIALSLFMLCSCSSLSDAVNSSDGETDPISAPTSEMDIHTFYLQYNEENAKAWEQLDKSGRQTFTEDFDGLVITVTTDKSEYSLDEPIRVKATLQNKTGRDIYLFYSNSYKNYPIEFYADLSRGGKHLLNDRLDGVRDCVVEIITVKPDEERTDYLNYRTYCPKRDPRNVCDYEELAEKGVYSGSCWITVCLDPDDPIRDYADYSVDFSVALK